MRSRLSFSPLRAAALLILFLGAGRAVSADAPPNILFIRCDDLGRWAVGCHGNADAKTPNIDRIFREGAACMNAFTTTPVCSPSRAALMTGMHGIQIGVTEWINPNDANTGIDPELLLWPEVLNSAGYATGYFGKWHLGNAPEHHPTRNGFEEFVGMTGKTSVPFEPEIEIEGTLKKLPGIYAADFISDAALKFIGEQKSGPFLVFLDFREPHSPYGPAPEADAAQFRALDPAVPAAPGLDRERLKRLTKDYYAAIASADRNIGRALALLDELRLAQNTIVVFTSDNGYMLGHRGLWHKGNATIFPPEGGEVPKDPAGRRPNMFDESIRVPLAIRWPAKIKHGLVVDALVAQHDLYPTLLALAEAPLPDLPQKQKMEARDFSAALLGNPGSFEPREALFFDYDMSQGKPSRMRAIRTAGWKLVARLEDGRRSEELYDLAADPGETANLAASADLAPVLARLRLDLAAWQSRIGDAGLPMGEPAPAQ